MKLSLAIVSLVAVGSALPTQHANTESLESRGWFGTALKVGGAVRHGHLERRAWPKGLKIGGGITKDFLKE
ncbi:hypothetical protein FSST1_010219 [Fusarium sambucinum]